MLDTKEKPVEGKVTEPAKRWANRYRVIEGCVNRDNKKLLEPGQTFCDVHDWPTKEIAEQKGIERIERAVRRWGVALCEYIETVPVTP